MKRPTKREIAWALGISGPAFTKYVKRGCPTYSVDAARDWQTQNIDPTRRLVRQAGAAPADAGVDADSRIRLVHALFELAAIDFPQYADRLRAAMRAVPPSLRPRVLIDLDVMRLLLPARLDEVVPPNPEAAAAQSDEDADAAGAILYGLACGELVLR